MIFHMSRPQKVMRECAIHHTRSIETNSTVDLIHKHGQGLCCDLLQSITGNSTHLFFYTLHYHIYVHRSCSPITLIFFHMKCNQIQFSYCTDDSFCPILLYCVYHLPCHAYFTPPSMRVIWYPCAEWLWETSSLKNRPVDPGHNQGNHRLILFHEELICNTREAYH